MIRSPLLRALFFTSKTHVKPSLEISDFIEGHRGFVGVVYVAGFFGNYCTSPRRFMAGAGALC